MQKYKDIEELIRIIQNKIGRFIQLEDNILKSNLDDLSYKDYDKFRRNILRNIEMFVIPNVINFYYRDRLIKYFIKESDYISLDNLYNNEYKELVNIFITSFYLEYSGQDSLVNNIDNLQIKVLQKLKNEYFEGLANSSLSNINKNDYIFQFLDYVVNEYNLNNCGLNILTRFFFEQLRFQDINQDVFVRLENYNKYFDKETIKMIFNLKKIYYTIFKIAKIGGVTLNKLLLEKPIKELTFDFNSELTFQSKLIEEDVLKIESDFYYKGNTIFSTRYKRNNQIKYLNFHFFNERGKKLDIFPDFTYFYKNPSKHYIIGLDKLCLITELTPCDNKFDVVDHNGKLMYSSTSFIKSDENIDYIEHLELCSDRYLKIIYYYYKFGKPSINSVYYKNKYSLNALGVIRDYELLVKKTCYIDLIDNFKLLTEQQMKKRKQKQLVNDSIDFSTLSVTTEKPLLELHDLLFDNNLKQEKQLVLK